MGIIPIQAFGGLGVCDVMSMYLYGLFGINQPEIAAILIGSRIIFYVVYGVMLLYIPIESWLNRKVDLK
jgi:uncharacterized membrane protein YbhN (UPF0104 family)